MQAVARALGSDCGKLVIRGSLQPLGQAGRKVKVQPFVNPTITQPDTW